MLVELDQLLHAVHCEAMTRGKLELRNDTGCGGSVPTCHCQHVSRERR